MSKIFNISLNDALRLAGLNKTEEAIIGLLKQAKRPLTVGKVQDELKLERLVVFYNLKKLEKRGIAAHDSSRKAHRWALHMPTKETVSSRNHVISIEEAYRMLNESQSRKLYGIQGANAVKSLIKMVEHGDFTRIHVRQKLRQVVIDGILTDQGAELIKGLPGSMLKSHFGRPTILHIIPDNDFIADYEILSDGKTLFVINHKTKNVSVSSGAEGFIALLETLKLGAIKKKPTEVYGELNP